MNSSEADWIYKGVLIRRREKDGLVSISDVWKAEGKPRMGRPDEWIKSRSVQEELRAIAEETGATVKYYPNGSIACVEGVLDIVRGGGSLVQGVFGNSKFAIGYADALSCVCGQWAAQNFAPKPNVLPDAITPFRHVFEGKEVRFVGTWDKPEWIAQDVCQCLELEDTSKAIEPLDDDEKGTKIVRTLGGDQEMLTVLEPGLYRLIFKSRKPAARRFKRWIWHDVIPALRKTGTYSLIQAEVSLEQQIALWEQRLAVRLNLKEELRVELVDAALVYIRAERINPIKTLSDMHDTINERIQGIKAREVRERNKFPKHVLLRDYYEKSPLEEISAINRLGANYISRYNMHPVDAIHKACDDFLRDDHVPLPLPIVENVNAQGRRLKADKKKKELGEGKQLKLWEDNEAS
jgi:prophage antirepressor-like protein